MITRITHDKLENNRFISFSAKSMLTGSNLGHKLQNCPKRSRTSIRMKITAKNTFIVLVNYADLHVCNVLGQIFFFTSGNLSIA